MKLLLTAFDPFGGEPVNPAEDAVKLIPDSLHGFEIVKVTVPTVFGAAIDTVTAAIEKERPDVVFCIGQAGGRDSITPERVAINVNDASIPDNAGSSPVDTPVFADGPAAYFSTLPIKAMAEKINAAGIRAAVSNTAGTFVCNHLMYGVLYTLDRHYPGIIGGFMHVPYETSQVADKPGTPSMSLDAIVRGIDLAISAISDNI